MQRTEIKIGSQFGNWTVIDNKRNGKTNPKIMCLCACGTAKLVQIGDLKSQKSTSCGCLRKKALRERRLKHGQSSTRTYKIWCGMIKRCCNPKAAYYKYYGGKGIKVCERWRNFENFFEDMGEAPKNYSIDRIDSDLDYCLENCRWVTAKEQASNRKSRNTQSQRNLEIDGKTQSISKWCKEYRINFNTVCSRLSTGMSLKEALAKPVQK